MMLVVGEILSSVVDCCFVSLKNSLTDAVDRGKLHDDITDYANRVFENEITNTDLKFDYQGFLGYINGDAVKDIEAYLRELDITASNRQKDLIVAKAIEHSSSIRQDQSKKLAEKLILIILDIVKHFYSSKVTTGEIILVGDSTRQIIENDDKNTDKVLTEINSLREPQHTIKYDEKFITYPPEQLSIETYGFREKDVSEIIKKIKSGKKRLLLSGIGGVGKTTIAKDLYHKLKDSYAHVAWITYQDNLSDSILSACSLFLDIKGNRLEIIINYLLNQKSDLLIFIDNVWGNTTDDKVLKTFAGMDATILLTTRLNNISAFSEYKIGFLSEEQAIELFYLYYKYDKEKAEKETVGKLVKLVACHTLTVELLAKSANLPSTKIEEYYNNLIEKGFTAPKIKVKTDHNEIAQTIAEHLKLLYNISTVTPEESRILQIFSFLPSRTMPVDFSDWIGCDINDLVHLSDLGWLASTEEGYIMHQVIGDAIRLNDCDKNCLDVFVKLILSGKFFNDSEDYIKTGLKLQVANSVLEHCSFNDKELSEMYSCIAGVYQDQGDYDKAFKFYNNALLIRKKIFGDEHPSTATIYNNLALVYQAQGDYNNALKFNNKALLIREKVLDEEHPSIATTYNNIAGVYQDQGNYDNALKFYKKALLICEKLLDGEHPDMARTCNNIAGVYQDQGNYDKALELYNKSLLINEKVLGTERPSTATTYNNIAGVYQAQGNYDKALEFYNKALLIREKVLGKEHPDTAATYNNIAGVYQAQGNYDKALEFYNKALLICERVLGKEHPDTASTYNNIAVVYQAQGNYDKALEFYDKALLIGEKVLGTEHPSTATTYNNIAVAYKAQGNYDKALEFYNKALLICEKVLGKEHPDTATTYNNIAGVYQAQGNYDKALEFYKKAITIFVVKFGISHPNSQIIYHNAKHCCSLAGKDEIEVDKWLQENI